MRCYIVDDQQHGIVNLSRKILKTPGLELVGSETDPVIAVNKILSGVVQTDVVFADVDMPDLNGLDLARSIQGKAFIIFVTGHPDFALDAIDIGAVDYLLKPVSTVHFLRAIERVRERAANRFKTGIKSVDHIYIKNNSRLTRIFLNDLMWIQGNNKYVNLYFNDIKPLILVSSTLTHLESILPLDTFVRIHKSHIINLNYVLSITNATVTLKNKTRLDIGPAYQDGFYKRLRIL